MRRLLAFLGLKTRRSAWLFLLASLGLGLFGIWPFLDADSEAGESFSWESDAIFIVPWVVITGIYVCLSIWALFSQRGQLALEEADGLNPDRRLTVGRLYEVFAGSVAAGLVSLVIVLFVIWLVMGWGILEKLNELWFIVGLIIASVAWAPFIARRMR